MHAARDRKKLIHLEKQVNQLRALRGIKIIVKENYIKED